MSDNDETYAGRPSFAASGADERDALNSRRATPNGVAADAPRACAPYARRLPLLALGLLDEAESEPVCGHLAECARCQQRFAEYAAVRAPLVRWAAREQPSLALSALPTSTETPADVAPVAHAVASRDGRQPASADLGSRTPVRASAPHRRFTGLWRGASALVALLIVALLAGLFADARGVFPFGQTHSGCGAEPCVTVFPVHPGTPRQVGPLTRGPDGQLWFFLFGLGQDGRIWSVTTQGQVTEHRMPNGPLDPPFTPIAVGPHETLWFGDDAHHAIWRYDIRSGATTMFSVHVAPAMVAVGSDGAVWFDDGSLDNTIWRLNPATGALTGYMLPSAIFGVGATTRLGAGALVVAPDGSIWFAVGARVYNAWLARLDPTKDDVRAFAVPLAQQVANPILEEAPQSLTVGPNGTIWYAFASATPANNQVGYVSASQGVTAFQLGANSTPLGIAPGPDGAMWFTESVATDNNGRLGRITSQGAIEEYNWFPTIPRSSQAVGVPQSITLGADGRLWVNYLTVIQHLHDAEFGSIVRITVPG